MENQWKIGMGSRWQEQRQQHQTVPTSTVFLTSTRKGKQARLVFTLKCPWWRSKDINGIMVFNLYPWVHGFLIFCVTKRESTHKALLLHTKVRRLPGERHLGNCLPLSWWLFSWDTVFTEGMTVRQTMVIQPWVSGRRVSLSLQKTNWQFWCHW